MSESHDHVADAANGEHRAALADSAQALLPEIREMADEIDDARRLPEGLVETLADAGFFRMVLGREFGGLETDPVTAVKVVETLSSANASVGWVVAIISSTVYWCACGLADQEAGRLFMPGPPPNVAGTLVPHGRAVKSGDGWRLSGQWPFGSACQHSQWMTSGSWLHDESGPITGEDGQPQWRVFLTPISDCTILDTWHTTGLRGTGSHDYTIDDVFVPHRMSFTHPLMSDPVRPAPQYAYPATTVAMLSAVSLGAARGAVDGLIELLGGKVDRRSGRPVAASFDKQADLGMAETLVGSAQAYLHETLALVWEQVTQGQPPTLELRARLRLACTNAVTASVAAVDRVYGAAGASSIYVSSSLERYFRDVHTAAAHAFLRPSTVADGGALLLGQRPTPSVF